MMNWQFVVAANFEPTSVAVAATSALWKIEDLKVSYISLDVDQYTSRATSEPFLYEFNEDEAKELFDEFDSYKKFNQWLALKHEVLKTTYAMISYQGVEIPFWIEYRTKERCEIVYGKDADKDLVIALHNKMLQLIHDTLKQDVAGTDRCIPATPPALTWSLDDVEVLEPLTPVYSKEQETGKLTEEIFQEYMTRLVKGRVYVVKIDKLYGRNNILVNRKVTTKDEGTEWVLAFTDINLITNNFMFPKIETTTMKELFQKELRVLVDPRGGANLGFTKTSYGKAKLHWLLTRNTGKE